MQTHARRRKAYGLAALSLTATGAVFGQAEGAPGTAKEPRPASSFRLKIGGVEGSHVKNGSLTLKDIKKRQVFSYRAGQRLARRLPPIIARIEDTYTKGQADATFLTKAGAGVLLSKEEANQTFLTQSAAAPFLTQEEADALYAKKADIPASPVVAGTVLLGFEDPPAKVLTIPGVGDLTADTGSSSNTFSLNPVSTVSVQISDGASGAAQPGLPYTFQIAPGDVITLQLVTPQGRIVSIITSAATGSPRQMTAQALISGP